MTKYRLKHDYAGLTKGQESDFVVDGRVTFSHDTGYGCMLPIEAGLRDGIIEQVEEEKPAFTATDLWEIACFAVERWESSVLINHEDPFWKEPITKKKKKRKQRNNGSQTNEKAVTADQGAQISDNPDNRQVLASALTFRADGGVMRIEVKGDNPRDSTTT